jgi:hypothetical protein
MFMIEYIDYVHTCCTKTLFSKLGVTEPWKFSEIEIFEWAYIFTYDKEEMDNQKKLFFREIRSDPVLNRVVEMTVKGSDFTKDRIIEDIYEYSFIKVYMLCYSFKKDGRVGLGAYPYNSHVFTGHMELFRNFVMLSSMYQMSSQEVFRTTISKELDIDEDIYQTLKDTDIYKESVVPGFTGHIHNPTYERLLQAWNLSDGQISISRVDEMGTDFNAKNSPLGNMCYRIPNLEVATDVPTYVDYVTTESSWTDHISKYWNIANFIKLVSFPSSFSQLYNYPLDSINANSMSKNCLFAQIQAITGIDCSARYSTYGGNFPRTRGYGGTSNFPR